MTEPRAGRAIAGFDFDPRERFALELDERDAVARYRSRFRIPQHGGESVAYFCGNSLGLQPLTARSYVDYELDDWASLAVNAHFAGRTPWYSYHELFRESGARLVGAKPGEVVMMNSLTVNLHLMLVSFYRPSGSRYKILIEGGAFPSDNYAVESQVRFHGFDPDDAILFVAPRAGGCEIEAAEIERTLEEHGPEIALVMLGGVNYFSGQLFDLQRVTELGHKHGAVVGFDLAHAAGNAELALHDWNVDFAVWCSYKYLNAGPGAVAGCFVHQRSSEASGRPRFAGWWGNDPATRFESHHDLRFKPFPGAEGWQLSNPPILALAPLRASLEIFDEVGMSALRAKSVRLTAYLEAWLERIADPRIEIRTPRDPRRRGCQLSLRIREGARELQQTLAARGAVVDFRSPDVIRVAPVPLYNSFHDVWRLGKTLEAWHACGSRR